MKKDEAIRTIMEAFLLKGRLFEEQLDFYGYCTQEDVHRLKELLQELSERQLEWIISKFKEGVEEEYFVNWRTCPFCLVILELYEEFSCENCPYGEIHEICQSANSTYSDLVRHYEQNDFDTEYAKRRLLEVLQPKEEVRNEV